MNYSHVIRGTIRDFLMSMSTLSLGYDYLKGKSLVLRSEVKVNSYF